jgi:mRNA-degrading endonuclease RelE of RelBE toxin-antitoxin system
MRLAFSPGFERAFRRLGPERQAQARAAIETLLTDERHPSLHFEKLKGIVDVWTVRVNRRDRIFLRRSTDHRGVYYLAFHVGAHDYYGRLSH